MTTRQPATIAVRTGIESDSQYHAVVPPIYLSTNFGFPAFGEVPTYDYTRSGNPNRSLLEQTLADLEGASGDCHQLWNLSYQSVDFDLLSPQEWIVAPHDCYGGTYRLLNSRAKKAISKSCLLINPIRLR